MSTNFPTTVAHDDGIGPEIREVVRPVMKMGIDGIDVYIAWPSLETPKLAAAAQKANGGGLELTMIDNRSPRFTVSNGDATSKKTVAVLGRVLEQGLEIVKTESGYTLSHGH